MPGQSREYSVYMFSSFLVSSGPNMAMTSVTMVSRIDKSLSRCPCCFQRRGGRAFGCCEPVGSASKQSWGEGGSVDEGRVRWSLTAARPWLNRHANLPKDCDLTGLLQKWKWAQNQKWQRNGRRNGQRPPTGQGPATQMAGQLKSGDFPGHLPGHFCLAIFGSGPVFPFCSSPAKSQPKERYSTFLNFVHQWGPSQVISIKEGYHQIFNITHKEHFVFWGVEHGAVLITYKYFGRSFVCNQRVLWRNTLSQGPLLSTMMLLLHLKKGTKESGPGPSGFLLGLKEYFLSIHMYIYIYI